MAIEMGNTERESWWITNNSNSTVVIGDLPTIPALLPGKRIDLLSFINKNAVSKSCVLCELIRSGVLSLNKHRYSPRSSDDHNVPASHAGTAITPAEEDETLGGQISISVDKAVLRSDLESNTLVETDITIEPDCCVNNVGSIQFDITHADGSEEGKLQWNAEDGTLEYGLSGGVVNLQVGQETLVKCKNTSGEDMPNGTVVYVSGASGSRPTIGFSHANNNRHATSTIGLTTEPITKNQTGYVTTFGLVRDIKTDVCDHGFPLAEGMAVFVSGTTPGAICRQPATPPANTVFIGVVMRAHATEGVLFVAPHPVPRLSEISTVYINGGEPTEQDILQWVISDPSAGVGRWENTKEPSFETLKLTDLPTGDPSDTGALWNDGGTLKISAG